MIRNNTSISNFGSGFRWKNEYPWCIIEVKSKHFPTVLKTIEKNKKKNDGKTAIFTQNQFSTESIFLYGCNSKTNHCKYLKFSPNVYVMSVKKFWMTKKLENLIQVQIFTKSVENAKICNVDKIFLALSKYLKILYKVPHMHNFFLLAFEVQIFTKIRHHRPPFSPTTGNFKLYLRLTNHLCSESFFVYNDTYHCIQI
ncbi:hypothetical protein AGLY_013533 [Aphis glycines]|uniref:Uncharacterized protein n=1 Tax=Aphis glycines TaxID=307491 RepID=A0A6G0T8Q7_APHGL|nr:hypothetical protein AGLY_013533 [Aphis glycines]